MHKTLSIIGCGNVGKTLGHLWSVNRVLEIRDVLNRSTESAERAVSFIGAGRAVAQFADLQPADIYLIGTSDDQIVNACRQLADTGLASSGTIVFHCSGALESSALRAAMEQDGIAASIHPIRSFADPEKLIAEFGGTYCGMEGDRRALDVLEPAFTAIGAKPLPINAESKVIYHSASVFASNYLVSLLHVALEGYVESGIPRDQALKLMEPLVRNTLDNVLRLGPARALSGPIARGDMDTALAQYRAVSRWDRQYREVYRQLGKVAARVAGRTEDPFG